MPGMSSRAVSKEGKRWIDKVHHPGGMGKGERLPGFQKFNAISNGYGTSMVKAYGFRG